jgi:thiol:disulfide interchange protein DsbD
MNRWTSSARNHRLAGVLATGVLPAVLTAAADPDLESDPLESAGAPNPVNVSVVAAQNGARPSGTIDLAVVLAIDPGWHVNAHEPLEDWLIPTEVVVDSSDAFEILEIVYPKPERLKFSFSETDMAVYAGGAPIGVRVRLSGDVKAKRVSFSGALHFQACDDQMCLPPAERRFSHSIEVLSEGGAVAMRNGDLFASIPFQAAGAEAVADSRAEAPGDAGGAGLNERIVSTLERNFGNPLVAILLTLLAGLLSAATPCVYPMIPITARILMGRGGDNRALGRIHALAYFGGIILIYALLGFIAALTGGGFNELLRIPTVLLLFAILFTLLGLSMVGLFEIEIPNSIASRVDSSTSSRTGVAGTALMGVGAGLIVSPCVGPVVVFILTQIAAQIAAADAGTGGGLSSAGKMLYGSFLMAGYGAGLGIPFLVVGFFSARLARPGPWMTAVRVALGLVILYFAWDYFHKALDTAGAPRSASNAILTGAVLIFLAVMWGVFRTRIESGPHSGWYRVRQAGTIVMMVVGIFYLWTGLTRAGIAGGSATSTGGSSQGEPRLAELAIEQTDGLAWHRDLDLAMQKARAAELPIFVDFYAHWCANCKKFSKEAAKTGPLRETLDTVVLAKVYDTDAVFETFRNDPRFPELKRGLPFFLILSSAGDPLWKGTDYRAHDTMIRELERAKLLERNSS